MVDWVPEVKQNPSTCIIKAATNMATGVQLPTTRFLSSFPHLFFSRRLLLLLFLGLPLFFTVTHFQRFSLSTLSARLMASWDNFGSVEPSTFRSTSSDSWVSDAYARDTQGLAIALQKSLPGAISPSETNNSPFLDFMKPAATLAASSIPAGWDPEAALKLQLNPPAGRVCKRKSRASKRTQTTFIAADPEHFRQMVQHVTGVRIGDSPAAVLKLEPLRLDSRLAGGGCLPTLDTSAFFLNNHQNRLTGSTGAASASAEASPLSFIADVGTVGMDFDTLSSFPTLESWKVK